MLVGTMGRIGSSLRDIAGLRGLRHASRGSAAVELALVAPALFMFVFGIAETGRALWLQNALDYSVAQAARCASINLADCDTSTKTKSYAGSQSGYSFDASIFTAGPQSCGYQVSASYPMALTIPTLAISLTLTAQACYPS